MPPDLVGSAPVPLRLGIGEILGKKVGRGTCKCWGTVVVPGNQHSRVAESIADAHPVGQTEYQHLEGHPPVDAARVVQVAPQMQSLRKSVGPCG